jgi:hypothetical protein
MTDDIAIIDLAMAGDKQTASKQSKRMAFLCIISAKQCMHVLI